MFKDIINEKFDGDDVYSKIRKVLDIVLEFATENATEEGEKEFLEKFYTKYIDNIVGMYVDFFSKDELLSLIDFQLTETAKKNLLFQMKMNRYIGKKAVDMLMEETEKIEKEAMKNPFDVLKNMKDNPEFENNWWDTKE